MTERTADSIMHAIDCIVYSDARSPLRGWHDDYAGKDLRTAEYLPAIQQVKAEFRGIVDSIIANGLLGGRCLQLGIGRGGASHHAFRQMFDFVCSVDSDIEMTSDAQRYGFTEPAHDWFLHGRTNDHAVVTDVLGMEPFDLLFIDAGHRLSDVKHDFEVYSGMVRNGGLIVFHDALMRPGYEDEIEVWKFLEQRFVHPILMLGAEVGTAIIRMEDRWR